MEKILINAFLILAAAAFVFQFTGCASRPTKQQCIEMSRNLKHHSFTGNATRAELQSCLNQLVDNQ